MVYCCYRFATTVSKRREKLMTQTNYPVINMSEVGARIKRLRLANHLRVTDISDEMGFETPQAVYKWQRGDCLPEIVNLIILSRMFGTTVEAIVVGEEAEDSPPEYQKSA